MELEEAAFRAAAIAVDKRAPAAVTGPGFTLHGHVAFHERRPECRFSA
jgi:hypothetical protein